MNLIKSLNKIKEWGRKKNPLHLPLLAVNLMLLIAILVMLPQLITLQRQLKEYDVSMSDLSPISTADVINDITVIDDVNFPYRKVYSLNDNTPSRVSARGIWESYILNLLQEPGDNWYYGMYIDELTMLAESENEYVFLLRLNPKDVPADAEIITRTGKAPAQLRFQQMFRATFDPKEHRYYLSDIGAELDYADLPPYEGESE